LNKSAQTNSICQGIAVLSNYGLDRADAPETSREALRCLANAFLLDEPCRQIFVDLGYAPKAARRLKNDNWDDEFLVSRILFLLTYNTKLDFEMLITQHQLADSINQHVTTHAEVCCNSGSKESMASSMREMSMIETLKLLFNITYYYPHQSPAFTPSIEHLVNLLLHCPLQTQPLQPPVTYMLNVLLNLELRPSEGQASINGEATAESFFPHSGSRSLVERLVSILEGAIRHQPEAQLDQAAAPLFTLLRRIHEIVPDRTKLWMQELLLPTNEDREKPLGQGDSLSSRLLRLSCSPNLPTLRDNISSLLFELSDKDANKFVKNIGYGFASGFLISHNIQIQADAITYGSTKNDTDAESVSDVNPVTGQHLSAERADAPDLVEMTDEEKEREAEKLFVLFERLKATGVMDVKNPVQQAVDEGRFEELDD
jgi:hypothetical protein